MQHENFPVLPVNCSTHIQVFVSDNAQLSFWFKVTEHLNNATASHRSLQKIIFTMNRNLVSNQPLLHSKLCSQCSVWINRCQVGQQEWTSVKPPKFRCRRVLVQSAQALTSPCSQADKWQQNLRQKYKNSLSILRAFKESFIACNSTML